MTESKTQLARFTTVDPIRDGTNWLVYCNGDAVNFVDLWGLEILRKDTLTKEVYERNFQLQWQFSWNQIEEFFYENPKGIIYRYDTVSYLQYAMVKQSNVKLAHKKYIG